MPRIQCSPICSISLKQQEEESNRRMDLVPEKSALEVDEIHNAAPYAACKSGLPAASYKSTGWQPEFQPGTTSDSLALHVFDGMATPNYGMGSGLASSLQWNQSNSHTAPHHQILDTSSCSDYEMSAMTWSYCPTLQGRVLSVVMHQVKHPVPIDVLNHLFSVYGVVETIFQSLNQHGRKVLIQYQHGYMADNALQAAHGWYLYHTYCQLDIKHADPVELQILHDYSSALFSEINNDADHLSHESTAMPQNEVSDCSQLVTLHMKGHTSEQQVQSNIPVFNVVIIGTHEQKQRGGKHDAATVPNERVIEQPTLMQVLEELPSFHASKVAVQLCSSDVVQAATMLGQGNPASSTPLVMHVDDPQLPTHVQDASDLFEAMPVFDVYDDELDVGSNEFAQVFTGTPGQQPYEEEQHDTLEQQQQVKEKASVNVQQLRAPPLNVLLLHERRKEWDPGVPVLPHSYTAPHPIVTHPGDFTRRLQPIFASPVMSSIYLWLQVLTERIATEKSLSWLPIPELAKWQSQVTCASFVWDPGTILLGYTSKWWLLFTEEKTNWHKDINCYGIALWLITFNPP